MRVQHRACLQLTHDRNVQQRFRRRPPIAAHDVGGIIHLQEMSGSQVAFIEPCGGNSKPQGLMRENRAEVPAGAQDPAAPVESTPKLRQLPRKRRKISTGALRGLRPPPLRDFPFGLLALPHSPPFAVQTASVVFGTAPAYPKRAAASTPSRSRSPLS